MSRRVIEKSYLRRRTLSFSACPRFTSSSPMSRRQSHRILSPMCPHSTWASSHSNWAVRHSSSITTKQALPTRARSKYHFSMWHQNTLKSRPNAPTSSTLPLNPQLHAALPQTHPSRTYSDRPTPRSTRYRSHSTLRPTAKSLRQRVATTRRRTRERSPSTFLCIPAWAN